MTATRITITGTGVPHLAPGRAGPGVLVEHGDIRLQFDAGRATALRLIEAGVRTNQLTALFVTHHHSDHLVGLTAVLFSRWLESHGRFVPLPVIAPAGPSIGFLERMMDPWQADIAVRKVRLFSIAVLVFNFSCLVRSCFRVAQALHRLRTYLPRLTFH